MSGPAGAPANGPTVLPAVVPLDLAGRVDDVVAVEVSGGNLPERLSVSRRAVFLGHAENPEHRGRGLVLPDGTLVGFCYGYPTRAGTWWRDVVDQHLAEDRWRRGTFELAELHVAREWQGRGWGERLLRAVLAGCGEARALLTCKTEAQRAHALYDRLGFVVLAEGIRFTGYPDGYDVLGVELPLR